MFSEDVRKMSDSISAILPTTFFPRPAYKILYTGTEIFCNVIRLQEVPWLQTDSFPKARF